MRLIYLLILFFLITSFEMGSFNVFFGSEVHNSVIIVCFSIILFHFLLVTTQLGKIVNRGLLNPSEFKYFSAVILSSALYFIFHSVGIGPFSSMKYSSYLFILFILITQIQEKHFNRLCIIYIYFMAYVSLATVVQILLMSISGVSIFEFDSIKFIDDDFFRDVGYAMPYFLSFSSVEESVSFGPLRFVRAIGFSSEPKYFSVMLWLAYALSLGWDFFKYKKALFFIRISLLLGIFFSHAYSSILIIAVSYMFYWFMKLHFINTKAKMLLILFTPVLISIIVTMGVNIILGLFSGDNYMISRMESFLYTTGGLDLEKLSNFGLFGSNISIGEGEAPQGATMLLNWYRFGNVGFIVYLVPIMFVIYKSILKFRYLQQKQKYALAILLSVYVVFYQVFFSQPYTLLSCFVLASIYVRTHSSSHGALSR